MVKFLVPKFGVRVYKKNFFRETCRDLAEVKGHRHVVEYLDSDFPTLKAKVSVFAILHAGIEWISAVSDLVRYVRISYTTLKCGIN